MVTLGVLKGYSMGTLWVLRWYASARAARLHSDGEGAVRVELKANTKTQKHEE